ncbi:hypothetical protein SAMN06264868_12232 [Venenivibrio stagnispumantis]|uniref:Uncharacterized protein n=1 Tax=Venenivibrio stagnispumantis TaxID=407998 RepID=A0AA45WPE3_9AQUI|nr:hypothetical protein [Venenivibrio stagnispumantis]SMP21201.1 hypothetical protein SAMN06264868_12232 [Venenivibrio stagnispumantis]
MKIMNMQDLLGQYKIDVKYVKDFIDNDPVEIQELFYRRDEILKNFDNLTWKEIKEFLSIEKELSKYLKKIKQKYPLLYEKIVEPQNEYLKTKLIDIFVTF